MTLTLVLVKLYRTKENILSYEKKVKIVMLPTEEASKIYKHKTENILQYVDNYILKTNNHNNLEEYHKLAIKDNDWTSQHLYILSNEEIKEGDPILHDFGTVYLVKTLN